MSKTEGSQRFDGVCETERAEGSSVYGEPGVKSDDFRFLLMTNLHFTICHTDPVPLYFKADVYVPNTDDPGVSALGPGLFWRSSL